MDYTNEPVSSDLGLVLHVVGFLNTVTWVLDSTEYSVEMKLATMKGLLTSETIVFERVMAAYGSLIQTETKRESEDD